MPCGSAVQLPPSQTRMRMPAAEADPANMRAGGRLFIVARDGATGFPAGEDAFGAAAGTLARTSAAGAGAREPRGSAQMRTPARAATATRDKASVRRLPGRMLRQFTRTRIPPGEAGSVEA